MFIVTVKEITNPDEIINLSSFVIDVVYEEKSILYSDTIFIPSEAFTEYQGLELVSMSNGPDETQNVLGESVPCCFSLNFTVEIPLAAQDGSITI